MRTENKEKYTVNIVFVFIYLCTTIWHGSKRGQSFQRANMWRACHLSDTPIYKWNDGADTNNKKYVWKVTSTE